MPPPIALLQNKIYVALQGRMHRRGQPSLAFVCEEDIRAVWLNPETRLLWEFGAVWQWTTSESRLVQSDLLKILSLLVWINFTDWVHFNRLFLGSRSRFKDDALPITNISRLVECFPHQPAVRDQFLEKQYIFLPITITEDDDGVKEQSRWSHHYRLPSIESQPIGGGAGGDVTKELIAARHLKQKNGHDNSKAEWWACKRIKGTGEPDSVDFDTETGNQRQFKLSLTSNRNIMLSFATIIRGPDLCIISKLADCNLHEILTGECEEFSRYCTTVTPLALVQESYCLVGALKFLHNGLDTSNGTLFCAHMDLKPENVLVTWLQRRQGQYPVGFWQIADFGISRIKRPRQRVSQYLSPLPLGNMAAQVAGPEMTPTAATRGAGAFQAPEIGGNADRVVGQESDMWSFGCIFATVLAFASGGPNEVRRLYAARDDKDDDYFYGTKLANDREELCVKTRVVSHLNSLKPNESWMASSRSLVFDLLRIRPDSRLKATDAHLRLQKIQGTHIGQGVQICPWTIQFPVFPEPAGLEPIQDELFGRSIQRLPSWEAPEVSLVQHESSQGWLRDPVPSQHALQPPIERQPSRGWRSISIPRDQAGLEPVQRQMSMRSDHSNEAWQTAPMATSPGSSDKSPRGSLTSTATPRTPREYLEILARETPLFVRLEKPQNTRMSRLCPLAESIVYVSDSLLRVYSLDFLLEARRWEKERFGRSIRTIAAADVPSASQGSITWPAHLRNISTSIAGNFVAVLLKHEYDRQHQVRLHKFSADQHSLQNPSSDSLLLVETVTGTLHKVSVSTRGSVIAHLNSELRLLPLAERHSSSGLSQIPSRGSVENSVSPENRWISLPVIGELQDATFSHNGSWVYAWSRNATHNYWYIWRAYRGQSFIRGQSRFGADGVRGTTPNFIIPFASCPFFLACDNRGVLTMIGGYSSPGRYRRLPMRLPGVTAAAVTPDENAVIMVRKIQGQPHKHELSILHLPQDLATCNLEDDLWSSNGDVREIYRSSGALSLSRSTGVHLIGSSPDGTLERRLIAR